MIPPARIPLTITAHRHLQRVLRLGALAIDATAGNGFDTLFLAQGVGSEGKVLAFDIQAEALAATARRLQGAASQQQPVATVCLIEDSHANLPGHVPPQWAGRVCAITFNLGYLPGGDKAVVTRSASTLAALDACLPLLAADGLLSVLCYRGHTEGAAEALAVENWAAHRLDARNFTHSFTDAWAEAPPHAPRLLHVQRKRG